MSEFVHLHVHSEYSPLDAPISVKKLVPYAKKLGLKSLAITDHGTISAWIRFAMQCKENGIKPIFGIEAYFTPDRHIKTSRNENYHLILLAKNDAGIKNIFRLSELSYSEEAFYFDPRIDWEYLEKYREGLIVTSACIGGIVPDLFVKTGYDKAAEVAGKFKELFKDDYYLEVQNHNLESEKKAYAGVAQIASKLGIKIVGTNDVHYLTKDQVNIQEAMMALSMKKCLKDPSRYRHDTNQMYLKSADEMVAVFGGQMKQAVLSTLEIEEKCQASVKFGKSQLPKISIPPEFPSELEYLEHQARKGMKALGLEGKPEYEARFKEEMEVIRKIKEKGFSFERYFLIVSDYVNWAWDHGIRVGPGRGSGAASIILYCLRITGVDPIKYDLIFERFLQEDRNEMPDIDVDFDFEKGNQVFDYLRKTYGADHFARIGTISTYHVASALRAAFKVFDPGDMYEQEQAYKARAKNRKGPKVEMTTDKTYELAKQVSELLPRAGQVPGQASNPYQKKKSVDPKCTFSQEEAQKKPEEKICVYDAAPQLKQYKARYPEIFAFAEHLEGLVEKRGRHAAGVVITECPAVEVAPQHRCGKDTKGNVEIGTCFDMGDVEKMGCVKFDILQTKALPVISRIVEQVTKNGEWTFPFDIDHVPDDDPKVIELFAKGETLGIFQFEGEGMRRTLMAMKPTTFEDLIAANAMYRPGPMQFIDSYNKRKHNQEKVTYACPALEPVLDKTFGITVYQEQVMKATRVLAGFSASEADKVRKAMGKKKRDILDQMKGKFLEGCKKQKSCPESVAIELWTQMEDFAKYAFNKAHATGYAYTAYQEAFLKTYFPVEFYGAQISVEGGSGEFETVAKYENGARHDGIKILPLDINLSKPDYVVEIVGKQKCLRKGFKGTKGLGEVAYNSIAKGQPYEDIFDFCMKAGAGTKIDAVKELLANGAFESFKDGLAARFGKKKADITDQDLMAEYEDKVKRASREQNVKGARKEEKEGIGNIFAILESSEDDKLADGFSIRS